MSDASDNSEDLCESGGFCGICIAEDCNVRKAPREVVSDESA